LYLLGWLVASFGFANIWESILPLNKLPIPYLISPGVIEIREGPGNSGEEFVSDCDSLEDECLQMLQDCIGTRSSHGNWTWLGIPYLIRIPRNHVNKHEPVTHYLSHVLSSLLTKRAKLQCLDFVQGPRLRHGDSVLELPRFAWADPEVTIASAEAGEFALLERAAANPDALSLPEIMRIWHLGAKLTHHNRPQTLIEFSEPFEECLTSSYLFVNASHPLVRLAVQALAGALWGEAQGLISRPQSREIRNLVYGHNFVQWVSALTSILQKGTLLPATSHPTMVYNSNVPNLHLPGRGHKVPTNSVSSATLVGEIGSSLSSV